MYKNDERIENRKEYYGRWRYAVPCPQIISDKDGRMMTMMILCGYSFTESAAVWIWNYSVGYKF